MLGTITEEQFRFRIQCTEKAREKEKTIKDVLDMFVTVGTDLLNTLVANKDQRAFDEQHKWLLEYSNSELDKIRDLYRTMVPRIIGEELKNIQYERPSAARGQSPLGKEHESESPKTTGPPDQIPIVIM
jgi:hypothetical protein